jgi:hypothetical protein
MNYFAKLSNNIVIEVICLSETITDGVAWCIEQYGGDWVQTYDNNPTKTYGNISYTYDPTTDDFVAPVFEPDDEQ